MKTYWFLLISLCTFIAAWNKIFEKYRNDKPIRYYIGLRGKGKTTIATKKAIQHLKVGHNVYSNFELFGARRINPDDFGFYNVPVNSAIFFDECSLIWSNRNFSTFKKEVEEYLRLSRKRKVYIYLFSQSFDVDKKIRDIVDEIYIIDKYFGVFSVAKKINRSIVLHKASKDKDSGAQNGENFLSEDFKFSLPFNWEFTFIPRWVKFFNSFEAPELPKYEADKYHFNDLPTLYRNMYYKGYLINNLIDLKNYLFKQYRIIRNSFIIEPDYYRFINNFY